MSWECRFGFRPRDLRLRPTCCGPGNRFQSHQTRSSQPLGWAGAGCLLFRRDLVCFSPPVELFLESSICPISQAGNLLFHFALYFSASLLTNSTMRFLTTSGSTLTPNIFASKRTPDGVASCRVTKSFPFCSSNERLGRSLDP